MALEFYVVTNCPMRGLYRNLKMAKRQCQRYESAILHRFFSPKDISKARACCKSDGIRVLKSTWDDLYFAGKMSSVIITHKKPYAAKLLDNGTQIMKPGCDNIKETNVIDITSLTEAKYSDPKNKIETQLPQKRKKKYSIDITDPMLPKNVEAVVYTDASYIEIKKKKFGGYAALILLRKMGDAELMISGHRKKPKSCKFMELLAVYKALKQLKKYKIKGKVSLFCDSKVIVTQFNTKLLNWEQAHWRQNNGKRIKYWRLWKKIWEKTQLFEIELHWVKGHAGSIWNIRCDLAARAEAQILAM